MTDNTLAETQAKVMQQRELEDQLLATFAKLQLLSEELLARRTLSDKDREAVEDLQRQTLVTMKQIAAGVAAGIAELESNLAEVPPRPQLKG